MKSESSVKYFYILAALIVIALIVFAARKNETPSMYTDFAQCLTDNNVVMYGAWWCSHCENQKNLFGNAFKKVAYIECSPPENRSMNQVCKSAGIKGYPTWKFADGSQADGEQTFAELAERSGCELPNIE